MLATIAEPPTTRTFQPWLESMVDLSSGAESGCGWPLLTAPVPADDPVPADAVERFLSLDEHLVRNPANTFLMRVIGDGLADAGLHDGDLLVMDRTTPPLAGSVALAMVDGAFALARLYRLPDGRLMVQPAGSTDSGRLLDDAVAIAGVARWVIRRLWPGRLSTAGA
ncbi:MAG: S24 family peptidase [Candidatus Contendobacter sp.]|nr:S24 family peptidase [Candidatus Contendobacter sp.]